MRFFEIRADGEDSAVDAGLRFAVKERPLVKPLKHQPLVDAVNHFASLLAGGVETEIHQDDESVKGNQQAPVLPRQISSPPAGPRAQSPAGEWRARSWLPQPSVATRDRSAAIARGAEQPVRSLMTCQRMAGSESRSQLRCAGLGA